MAIPLRADRPGLPTEVVVEPGHRVVHVPAGPYDLPKEALPDQLSDSIAVGNVPDQVSLRREEIPLGR